MKVVKHGQSPAKSLLAFALLPVVALVSACAGGRGGLSAAEGGDPVFRQNVSVEIVNDNYYSARIRAHYDGGNEFIIGMVESHGSAENIEIPWQPGSLWFEIDLITGPGRYLSDRVLVEPGEIVQLRLPPDLEQSGFFRRIRG